MKITFITTAVLFAALTGVTAAEAQTRTPWLMHDGLEVTDTNPLGLVHLACAPDRHGATCEYAVATIPWEGDAGWRAAPNGDIIGFSIYPSRVCQAPYGQTCNVYADFTYFQTFVNIPSDVVVTQFTISFNGMDDGSRVTIFNSLYPDGYVVPGSYVFLGGSGTTDLSALVVSGEVNRVVVTQVDDCCIENNLREARVVLNGEVIDTGCHADSECDDGDACTTDTCLPDGSCAQTPLSCDDGNACTWEACQPALGCVYGTVDCDDGSLCTIDSCEPELGCTYVPVVCDDDNPCTADVCDPFLGCYSNPQCPDCSAAYASVATLWPPDHRNVAVQVLGVTDPQGQTANIRIDAVRQDEPTNGLGDGDFCPDALGLGSDTAYVKAERAGTPRVPGDGRVYSITFTATDPDGYACTGQVTTCAPHDMGRRNVCVNEGALYDSAMCF